MSYDIQLVDPVTRETLTIDEPHHLMGGTYCMGGTRELRLNVTYNYCDRFRRALGEKGMRAVYGMTGAESLPVLEAAVGSMPMLALSHRLHAGLARGALALPAQAP